MSDYGAFRDLQRHRLLTIEWQPLTVDLGFDVPEVVVEAGLAERYEESLCAVGRPLLRRRGRVPRTGAVLRGVGVSHPLRHADERPRGDAPHRASLGSPGAPELSTRRPGDGSTDSRTRPVIERSPTRCATSISPTPTSNGSKPSAPRSETVGIARISRFMHSLRHNGARSDK